jgi:hypothetical protein
VDLPSQRSSVFVLLCLACDERQNIHYKYLIRACISKSRKRGEKVVLVTVLIDRAPPHMGSKITLSRAKVPLEERELVSELQYVIDGHA